MRSATVVWLLLMLPAVLVGARAAHAAASPGPSAGAPVRPIAAPRDQPYPGVLRLSVDASDVQRRIVHVHETLSGVTPETVLLYPQWLPGTHAPEGPIDRLAGLRISANDHSVDWTRDRVNVFAFRLHAPRGASTVSIDFDYLSPTSPAVGDVEITPNLLTLEWSEALLYPAGYFARRIPVQASVTLPSGWQFATALAPGGRVVSTADSKRASFEQVDLATLVDSPLFAGRYASRLELDPGAAVPVHLDLFADAAQFLALPAQGLNAYRALVQQAYRLFGARHYAHYDFLYALSDQIEGAGLEHHQSSENSDDQDALTDWDKSAWNRDLLPHEFTHSWNGKFLRPADLWTPNFNVPMQDSLLWVYEGLTQYWGHVLAARSGLRTPAQARAQLALDAARDQLEPGRRWRSLQDTTNDEIINPRRPESWRDWQRFEDYYAEGALIWLDVDTLIRERSGGRRSLDDLARSFFGVHDGDMTTRTYTFEDLVKALNAVEPYDWGSFLHQRLEVANAPAPLDGIRRGGYRLTYTDVPDAYLAASDGSRHSVTLLYSIGLNLSDRDQPGTIAEVLWGGPAFQAGLTNGGQIIAVDGTAYSEDVLKEAIRGARDASAPIQLIVKVGSHYQVAEVNYHGGPRYPHLTRDGNGPSWLDAILAARPAPAGAAAH